VLFSGFHEVAMCTH